MANLDAGGADISRSGTFEVTAHEADAYTVNITIENRDAESSTLSFDGTYMTLRIDEFTLVFARP